MSHGAARPVTDADFAAAMMALGPFEASPQMAVAVSGGVDSMALVLLADGWARIRNGAAVALTVDHGLRVEAAGEAHQVGRWLAARGIHHHVLRWTGEKPRADVQARARAARYELLTNWCREAGILHLLLAHQQDDQAETFLLRLGRGSGVEGLAAMAPIVETAAVRLLRPLLGLPRDRLAAYVRLLGQEWIEDPSNQNAAHARIRVRSTLPSLSRVGLTADRLAATARRMARARGALEAMTASLLARAVRIAPAGYAYLNAARLAEAPEEVSLRALARIVLCIGGHAYGPRLDRLERLHLAVVGSAAGGMRGRTLGGCRFLPWRDPLRHGDCLLVCREPAAMAAPLALVCGPSGTWDGRFRFEIEGAWRPGLSAGGLGREGWMSVAAQNPGVRATPIPGPARPSLPAVRDLDGVLAVPHLGYIRSDGGSRAAFVVRARFHPAQALAGPVFAVA